MNKKPEVFFLPTDTGRLFTIYRPPNKEVADQGDVIFIQPFAEEMNKSRRMVALQACEFTKKGVGVLQIDLHGCGDSSGDFGEARWEIWKENINTAIEWLRRRGRNHFSLWGLRIGCLLMMDFARESSKFFEKLILWQPVVRGETMMTQFLRLRVAAQMLGAQKETTKSLRERLASREPLEIAGYKLHPDLVDAIDVLRLDSMGTDNTREIHWLQVVPENTCSLPPASHQVIEAWNNSGAQPVVETVTGDPFWATAEITIIPGLIDTTTRIFQENSRECN